MDAFQLLEISKGLLTPLIAGIVGYVAWQQWKLNERKHRLDLYDRRKRIYEEVKKLFNIISRNANVDIRELSDYWIAVSEADFLFGSDITDYLREIYDHGLKLWQWNSQRRTQEKPPNYDQQKVMQGMEEELTWLMEQGEPAKKKFKKYLNLR